jgi:cysteine synthase A
MDRFTCDQVIAVSDADAWEARGRLAREEGILAGVSSGAALVAALQVARELGKGSTVYTLFADTGERYFSLARKYA